MSAPSTSELDRLFSQYRAALNIARDENVADSTRSKAEQDACDLRLRLDEANLARQHEAELDQSRAAMEGIIRPIGHPGAMQRTADVQAFVAEPTPDGPQKRTLMVPMQMRADEEWYKGGANVYGQYTYTSDIAATVVHHENAESGVALAGPKVITTDQGRDLLWPTLTTDATAALTAERSAATLTYPVFGQQTIKSYRIDGYFVLTAEFMRDSQVDVAGEIAELAGRALATKYASYLAVGTGTDEPQGLSVGATSGKTAASATTFTFPELQDLYLSVLPRARRNGAFIMGSTAFGLTFKMTDDDSRPLLQPAVSAAASDTLMGRPIFEDAAYPSCVASAKPVTFGDTSGYLVRNVGPIVVERDDSVFFTKWETVIRFGHFFDARILGDSIKALTMAAA